MSNKGRALMGIGKGRGDARGEQAALAALQNNLLEDVDLSEVTGSLQVTLLS